MEEKKLSRKEREFLRHRQEILESALELFSEKGFHNITMHQIAGESEFAVGTLYKFFANKEDLYKALILEKSDEFHSTLMKAIDSGGDEMECIRGFLDTHITLFMENLKFVRLYFAETRGASFNIRAGLDEELRDRYDQILEKLADIFKRGIRKGLFKKFDPLLMATALNGITRALLFQRLDHGDEHPFDADMIIKIFFGQVFEE